MKDIQALGAGVTERYSAGTAMAICGGSTRALPDLPAAAEPFSVRDYRGVIDYHPEELVIRARAGTPMLELIELLASEGQMLAFDPPVPDPASTLGGAVATGLSGSRRPYTGSVRDYVLGVGMILHDGEYLSFGGQVMKNVAGYDVSRLVCGSYGILGVIADVSLKVLPKPEREATVCFETSVDAAISLLVQRRQHVNAISAACYLQGQLYLRLSGSESALREELSELGGETLDNSFWPQFDIQKLEPLASAQEIWRLSTSPAEALHHSDCTIFDWGFAQRWLIDPEAHPRTGYQGKGHWTRVRGPASAGIDDVFEPLPPTTLALHQRIKSVFDPAGLFNPGRMYREL